MNKWLKTIMMLTAAGLLQAGCVYTHVQVPLDTNFDKTELGTKKGEADIHSVMWLVAWGDGGTQAAAKAGDIKVIRHADSELHLYLFGVYAKLATIVYGD